MSSPKHHNPTTHQRTASAPYNFVPLPEKVVKAVDDPEKELPDHDTYANKNYPHTGYFEITLETKSPLYIRCPLTRDEFDLDEQGKDRNGRKVDNQTLYRDRIKNTPDFFYTSDPGQPVIPGSSLRGMLRGLLEIVSYGKVGPVSNSLRVTYRAVAAAKDDPLAEPYRNVIGRFGRNVCAGYLVQQNDGWYIRPAKRPSDLKLPDQDAYLKVKERHIPNNAIPDFVGLNSDSYKPQYHKVTFDKEIRKGKRGNYTLVTKIGSIQAGYPFRGVLVCSGNMLETGGGSNVSPRKNHALVLDPKEKARLLKLKDQVISDYVGALTPFLMEPPFDKQNGCLENGRPVFYVEHQGEVICFGHCPNFRIPAFQGKENRAVTPLDFTPPELRRVEEIDYAEALFGYAKGNSVTATPNSKARAYASRIFITDARTVETDIWLTQAAITPKILATPKPTTFQHYLVQSPEQSSDNKHDLKHYGSSSLTETVIRGHKLYWHQDDRTARQLQPNPEHGELEPTPTSTQHTQFKPVKSGVTFSFRAYFENLSDEELGALCWVLHPLGDDKKEYCHSLGMGKPLGMGAVKLKATLHETDRTARYGSLFAGSSWQTGEEPVKDLSDRDTLIQLTQKFEQCLLDELQPKKRNNPDAPCSHIFELTRIGMLLKMLEWPGFLPELPPTPNNRFLMNQGRPNTRYMTVQLPDVPRNLSNEYRDRPVLPDPSSFGELTGDAEPTLATNDTEGEVTDTPTSAPTPQSTDKPKQTSPGDSAASLLLATLKEPKPVKPKPVIKAASKEQVTLLTDAKNRKAQVRTEQGEEIPCMGLPMTYPPRAGDQCRARVTRVDGHAVEAVFEGW